MEKERDEQVIYFKDLVFAALYQWRRMLAAGLALCLLLGGFAVVSQLGGNDPVEQEQQAGETVKRELEQQLTYNQESLLMQLNPYGVYAATLELAVDSDYQIQPGMVYQSPDMTETLLYGYQAQLSAESVVGAAAKALGMPSQYLQELLKIEIAATARSLRLTVSCGEEKMAEKLLQTFTDSLPAAQQQVTEAVGAHQITVLAGSVKQKVDTEIAKKQADAMERTEKLQDALAEAEAAQPAAGGISKKKVVLLAALGFIAGAGLVACWAWFCHIAGGKVYSRRTLVNHTGIRLIAQIGTKNPKNAIDRLLRKLEGRVMGQWDTQMAVVAAYLRNCAMENAPLLLTGDGSGEQIAKVAQSLQAAGISVVAGGSLLRDPQTLDALKGCGQVVLVEQTDVSAYQNVEQQMELLQQLDKPLIGCVLLDI